MLDRRVIWLIIGLMGAALIGIMWMQIRWINWNIDINKVKFNNNVYAAMNRVADKLQILEENQLELERMRYLDSPEAMLQEDVTQEIKQEGNIVSVEFKFKQDIFRDTARKEGPFPREGNQTTDIQPSLFEQWKTFYQKRMMNPPDIEERIDLEQLDVLLQQELHNRGIYTPYDYGVFSTDKKAFVIKNNHFVIPSDDVEACEHDLYQTPYKVHLFPKDDLPSGLLMINFPNKASVLWGSVWQSLIFSILFAAVILFCFIYTVQVIFRQKEISEMKTDFINNMTHEFKTPIATISLAADSISTPKILSDESKVSRFVDIIKQENKRMHSQVEKVLQMALIDKRDFEIHTSDVNIHDLVHQAVEFTELKVKHRDGQIKKELHATNPVIEGDDTHIMNVIHNLLDNANKYSPEKPDITVSTKNYENGVELRISDKGVGMSKEARKHIFDKFYRVHTGNLHDVKGFGLGLSYVKAIVTAHDGEIDVKSEPGKGSEFILRFPHRVEK